VHWDVSPFKWQIQRNDGGVWGADPDGESDTIVLRSTEQTVDGRWRMDDPAQRKLSDSERASALLAEGDLVVTKSSGSSLHIGKTTIVTAEIADMGCCYSNFMQRIRTTASFNPKLAWYVMNNDITRLQFDLLSNSTTGLANLNGTMIGQVLVAVPPMDEQAHIAAFLDRETAKIDALVEEQKRLIELLKEKRQAVISQAVTKGLDPSVPMKDSGVEWLGEVPAHWNVMVLKREAEFVTSGARGWAGNYSEDGELFLRIGNLTRDSIHLDLSDIQRVVVPASAESERTRALPGDLVFSITAYLGSVAVIPADLEPAYVSQHVALVRLRGTRLRPAWAAYVAASVVGKTYLETQGYGGTKIQLSLGDVGNLLMLVPPTEEQLRIVDYIERETSKIDELIKGAASAMLLLQERRSALISAAVTGKIDVRGLGQRTDGDEPSSRHDESHDLQCERSNAGAQHVAHHRQ
jgi:type I restriction enzyme S subunit